MGIWENRKPYSWYHVFMKTTLDLPDELMRAVKIRAVQEDRKLKEMVAHLLRRGLALESEDRGPVRERVELPLVECAHEARPDEEMTPERVSRTLLEEEAPETSRRDP